MPIYNQDYPGDNLAYESIGTLTSAKGFTSTYLSLSPTGLPMKNAVITCETDNVRFRTDGTAPTGDEGQELTVGSNYTVAGTVNCQNFRAINMSGSTGAVLKCSYYY